MSNIIKFPDRENKEDESVGIVASYFKRQRELQEEKKRRNQKIFNAVFVFLVGFVAGTIFTFTSLV